MATLTMRTNVLKGSLTEVAGIGMEVPLSGVSTLVLTDSADIMLCQGADDLRTFLTDGAYGAGASSTIEILDDSGTLVDDGDALAYLDSLASGAFTEQDKLNLEMEMQYKTALPLYFSEMSYTGNNLTLLELWEEPGKVTQIFGRTFGYTGNNLTSSVLTRISDGATLTFAYAYTGNNLLSITRT